MDKESKRIGVISSQDHEEFFNDALAERLNDVDGCEGGLIDRLNYYHDVNVRTVIVDDDILVGRPDAEDALVNWIKTVTAPKVNIILFVDEARDEEDPFLYRLVSDAGVTDIMIAGNEGDPKRRLLEIIDNGMTLAEYSRWKTDEKPWEAKKKGVFGRLGLGGKKKAEKKSSKKSKKAKRKEKEADTTELEKAFEESAAEETESDLLDEVYKEKPEETAVVDEEGEADNDGTDGTQAAEPGSLYDLDFDDLDLPSENAEKAVTEGKNEAEETKPLDLSQLMLGTDPALPKVPVEAPRAPETATEGTVPTFAGATQEDIDAMVPRGP